MSVILIMFALRFSSLGVTFPGFVWFLVWSLYTIRTAAGLAKEYTSRSK